MNDKTRSIIGWVLSGLLAALFLWSASGKLMATPEHLKMAEGMGITATWFTIIGVAELLSVILFLVPRTGVLGTLLLAAYVGGAIATHLQHDHTVATVYTPIIIEALIWITAAIRFPELTERLMGRRV